MDLNRIMDRCRLGDELAWETLVRQFQGRVFGLAYHYTGNRDDASELAQEIFVRIYQNLNSCKSSEMFIPWLMRIARNLIIDHLRHKKARPPASDISPEDLWNLPASGNNPEEEWAANSRKQLISRALQDLTELNREIILLKEIQGLTLEEIAVLLKVPLGTVKSRSNRARVELAERVLALSGSSPKCS